MLRPKVLLLFFTLVLTVAWLSSSGIWKRTKVNRVEPSLEKHAFSLKTMQKLRGKADAAAAFIHQKNFNDNICFLIDMSLASGQNRFFVYDLKKDTLQNSGLVTHGRCNKNWLEGRKYGNTVGCGCSSLGKYKVGYSYKGRFGLAFKLHGLEKTNNNAFARFVVLHAHDCVPETEVADDICQSDGCPTVAPGFLQQLNPIISESKKPVLLWIFD